MHYDPMMGPDPEEWATLSELEQLDAVLAFHRQASIKLPHATLHATFHSVVENQILLGAETPVAVTLHRLIEEGLDRHEAVHAIGMVLAPHIHDLLHGAEPADGDPNRPYYEALRQFTAAQWREEAG